MTSRPRSLGLLALALVACTNAGMDSTDPPSTGVVVPLPTIPSSDGVPGEQRQYFEDGKVTLAEYQDAYSAFAKCATDAGIGDYLREQGRDEVTGLIIYSTQTLLLPAGQSNGTRLNDCFQSHFAYVEMAFQTSDPAVLAMDAQQQMDFFNDNFRPCLELIGVAVPDDLEFNDENWAQLYEEAQGALQDGRCSFGDTGG